MTDQELIKQIKLGNKDLFAEIIVRYEDKITRYIKKFIWNVDDCDDVIQNIFTKSYVYLNTYDENQSFNSWLYRIAHNEAINFLKKNKLGSVSLIDIDTFIPFLSSNEKSDDDALYRENKELVEKHLKILESKYREIIVLYFFEDLTYEEISSVLQIPKSTVGVRLNRAKQKLKKILEENSYSTIT